MFHFHDDGNLPNERIWFWWYVLRDTKQCIARRNFSQSVGRYGRRQLAAAVYAYSVSLILAISHPMQTRHALHSTTIAVNGPNVHSFVRAQWESALRRGREGDEAREETEETAIFSFRN